MEVEAFTSLYWITLPAHTYAHASHKFLKPLHFAGKTFLIKFSDKPFVLATKYIQKKTQSLQLANGNNQVYSSYIK